MGNPVQMTCLVLEGDTPLQISWTFQGLESSTRTQTGVTTMKVGTKSSLLLIDSADAEHSGNYTCSARNAAGVANYTAEIIVNGDLNWSILQRSFSNRISSFCMFRDLIFFCFFPEILHSVTPDHTIFIQPIWRRESSSGRARNVTV